MKKTTVLNLDSTVDHMDQMMFLDKEPGIARFETAKHNVFEKLTEKQLSFFWRPEEVDLTQDRNEFDKFPEHWKFIFSSNIKYQTVLDSTVGRSMNLTLLPIVSDVSLENWVETWSFSETVHSRSYTHILRNLYNDPSKVFDEILLDDAIVKRAQSVTKYFDDLLLAQQKLASASDEEYADLLHDTKVKLYLMMHAANALESIRFYVSFVCTFNFLENNNVLEGNAKVMKLIARDEQLHLKGTQYILNAWHNSKDDPEMYDISLQYRERATQIFIDAAEQEKEWATHLLSKGGVPGITSDSLYKYVEYLADNRMRSVGLKSPYEKIKHPFPWLRSYLDNSSVQVAAQEAELSSYLVGDLNTTINKDDLHKLEY